MNTLLLVCLLPILCYGHGCKTCGEGTKKVFGVKLVNNSTFLKVHESAPTGIIQITTENNGGRCSQLCDEMAECQVFVYILKIGRCTLATGYELDKTKTVELEGMERRLFRKANVSVTRQYAEKYGADPAGTCISDEDFKKHLKGDHSFITDPLAENLSTKGSTPTQNNSGLGNEGRGSSTTKRHIETDPPVAGHIGPTTTTTRPELHAEISSSPSTQGLSTDNERATAPKMPTKPSDRPSSSSLSSSHALSTAAPELKSTREALDERTSEKDEPSLTTGQEQLETRPVEKTTKWDKYGPILGATLQATSETNGEEETEPETSKTTNRPTPLIERSEEEPEKETEEGREETTIRSSPSTDPSTLKATQQTLTDAGSSTNSYRLDNSTAVLSSTESSVTESAMPPSTSQQSSGTEVAPTTTVTSEASGATTTAGNGKTTSPLSTTLRSGHSSTPSVVSTGITDPLTDFTSDSSVGSTATSDAQEQEPLQTTTTLEVRTVESEGSTQAFSHTTETDWSTTPSSSSRRSSTPDTEFSTSSTTQLPPTSSDLSSTPSSTSFSRPSLTTHETGSATSSMVGRTTATTDSKEFVRGTSLETTSTTMDPEAQSTSETTSLVHTSSGNANVETTLLPSTETTTPSITEDTTETTMGGTDMTTDSTATSEPLVVSTDAPTTEQTTSTATPSTHAPLEVLTTTKDLSGLLGFLEIDGHRIDIPTTGLFNVNRQLKANSKIVVTVYPLCRMTVTWKHANGDRQPALYDNRKGPTNQLTDVNSQGIDRFVSAEGWCTTV